MDPSPLVLRDGSPLLVLCYGLCGDTPTNLQRDSSGVRLGAVVGELPLTSVQHNTAQSKIN